MELLKLNILKRKCYNENKNVKRLKGHIGNNRIEIKSDYAILYVYDIPYKIDINDVNKVRMFTWFLTGRDYPYAHIRPYGTVFLHHYILNLMGNKKVCIDHINRDKQDNRKNNLRIVERYINSLNRSSKGVYKTVGGKFYAQICIKGKRKHLGVFNTKEEAKRVYEEYKNHIINHANYKPED